VTCSPVVLEHAGQKVHGIMCHSGPRNRICGCGNNFTRVCDWKIGRIRTCDAALCDDCTTEPSKGKDLCPICAGIWATHPANKYQQQELAL